jgi:transcription antitermination factor NusG
VADIVGASHCPEAISDEEIAAIKTLMTSVLAYDSHPHLREDMQVEVVRGPLIQQAAAVEIDTRDVLAI